MSAEVPAELNAAAVEWLAQEQRDARARNEAIAELVAVPDAPGTDSAPAKTTAQVGHADLAQLLWTVVDIALCRVDPRLALQADESERLLAPTTKVLEKYMPGDFQVGPEWALAATAGAIYLPKVLALTSSPAPDAAAEVLAA